MNPPDLPNAVARLAKDSGNAGFLLQHHILAAQRLTALFARAQLHQRVTMSYDPTRIGGGRGKPEQGEIALSTAQARAQLNRLALELERDCWAILSDVCCFDLGLQEVEAKREWPRRGAKLVLRIALDHLATRWGLSEGGTGQGRGMTSWLEEKPAMFLD